MLAAAKWWADYRPGTGNLENWNPVPTVIDHTDEARRLLIVCREQAEAEYTAAETKGDSVGTTVWGRVSEQVRKLTLLYAVSENHLAPRIGLAAVEWASAFVMHQTRRMLFMAASHVADSEFDALCLRAIEKIRNAPGSEIGHSVLLKRLKIPKKEFADLMDTLACRGDVEVKDVTTSGRIWAKSAFTIGRADYQRQYEPILYGWPEKRGRHWCGARDQGDVWQIKKPQRNDLHPTMKPVELVVRAIQNSSLPGNVVLDPFAGSGTTCIAAEQTGRRALMMELDPRYCDVVVRRWEAFTGGKAERNPGAGTTTGGGQ